MKLLQLVALVFLTGFALYPQSDATISGKITDGSVSMPLPFATVVLSMPDDLQIVSGTTSDESGRFLLESIPPGKYQLYFSYLGFKTDSVDILVGVLNNIYDIGEVSLYPGAEQLSEVIVASERATVAAGLDKKMFLLSDQIAQSGGSVLDAMKALPGVTIDQEGNVLLRGSSQVAILVDSKQSGMTGFGNQQGLGNIPAANIERIEVINNPSAKYDATGMAGIINIVYKKETSTGFNGSLGINVGVGELTTRKPDLPTELGRYHRNPKLNPNFNFNYRTDRLNTYVQGEVLQQRKLPNNEFTTRHYFDGTSTISAVPENRTQTHYIFKGGTDWEIGKNDKLSFFTLFDYESHTDTAQVPFIDLISNQRYRYWHWREAEVTGYLNFSLNYTHRYPQAGHELNIGAQYVRGWEDEAYFLNDSSAIRIGTDATHLIATEHTTSFTSDYIKPLKSGRIEAGLKLQFRTIPVTYDVTRGQQSIIYEGIGDWSEWGETIYAGYFNYLLEKEKIDIEGGLRLEQTDVFYDIDPANIYYPRNDAYDYFRLFPNIRLTAKLSETNQLSLFYNNRVDRPGEPNVRIFPKYDDPELLKVGNPYVRPQFTRTYEVAYKRIWKKGSLFIATYFRQIDAPFLRIFNIDDSNADYSIINKIYHNVGSGANTGIELLWSQNVADTWKLSGSVNWYNNKIDAFDGQLLFPYERAFTIQETKDQTWDMKLNNQIELPGNFEIQLTAIYLAPKNIPQGRQLSRSSIDLGIKKSVLDGRGEIVFSFTDILNDFGIRQEIMESEFTALYENYFEIQVFRMGFNYKL